MPGVTWKIVQRGLHEGIVDGKRALYVSRTRDGWEYGTIADDGVYEVGGETTRPIARNKVLA